MRKVAFGAATLLALAFLACSNFGGEDEPGTTPPGADGGDEAGEGGAPRDGFLLQPFPAEPPFVIQGKRIKIPVKIQRGASFQDPVTITLAAPPKGISQLGNAVITGDSIDVELEVDASFKQGVVELLFEARSERTVTQTGKPKIFVRGPSGSLDTTFGVAGVLQGILGNDAFNIVDAVVLPDRRIILVGNCDQRTCVARVSDAGVQDGSYGDAGVARANYWYPAFGALSGDGLVLVHGQGYDGFPQATIALSRLDATGKVDAAFGNGSMPGGREYPPAAGAFIGPAGMVVDASGRILVPATLNTGNGLRVAILRALKDGAPDPTFGPNGVNAPSSFPDACSSGITLASDKLLVAGHSAPTKQTVLARLLPTGEPDPTFGSAGLFLLAGASSQSNGSVAAGVPIQPDGTLLLPIQQPQNVFAVGKVAADGKALVPTYGTAGISTFDGVLAYYGQLLPTTDGKLLAQAGFDIVRLDANGALDTTFASGGRLDMSGTLPRRMTLFDKERVIVSGGKQDPTVSRPRPHVRRYWL